MIKKSFFLFIMLLLALSLAWPISAIDRPPAYQAGEWVHLGGPIGGMGYDIRMNPFNPDVMMVTDALSGIHLSKDGGQTWQLSNTGIFERGGASMDVIAIFSAAWNPNEANIVWVGMQDLGAVYRSADGGQTWERRINGIKEKLGFTVRGITVQPGNSDVVYIMGELWSSVYSGQTRWGRGFDRAGGVVYKTENGGKQWQEIWRGDSLARYMLIHPQDPNILYMSTGIFDRESANSDPATGNPGGMGVLKSTDGGKTWATKNDGINNLYIGSLEMHPTNPDILIAGAGNHAYREGGGIYLTEDGGESWTFRDGFHITAVGFAPSDPSRVYATGEGPFYHSEDCGKSWDIYERLDLPGSGAWGPKGVYPGIPIDLEIDPHNPNRVFVNSYGGGNFLTEDGGQTWRIAARGYSGADLNGLAVSPVDPATVYANGRSGPHRSTDGGETWEGINAIGPGLPWIAEGSRITVNPSSPDHLLMASGHWGWTYESTDKGETWARRTTYWDYLRKNPGHTTQGAFALAFAPSDPKRAYFGFGIQFCATDADANICQEKTIENILVSYDGGTTWGRPKAPAQSVDQRVVAGGKAVNVRGGPGREHPVLGTLAPGTVITALKQDGDWLQFDFNGSPAWINAGLVTAATAGGHLENYTITAIVVHPQNADVLWVATMLGGVYKSEDGGASWRKMNNGLRDLQLFDLALTPLNPDVLYAGTASRALYKTEDGGKTWKPASVGMDANERVAAVVVDPARPEVVYAGDFPKRGVLQHQRREILAEDHEGPHLPLEQTPRYL